MNDPIQVQNEQLTNILQCVSPLKKCLSWLLPVVIALPSLSEHLEVLWWFIWACGTLMMPGSLAVPSIFMNNCVWGAAEMEEGGGIAARPPEVSRAQSLDIGAAEALSWHACRHGPTCSSRLVAFPERTSMITREQRDITLRYWTFKVQLTNLFLLSGFLYSTCSQGGVFYYWKRFSASTLHSNSLCITTSIIRAV